MRLTYYARLCMLIHYCHHVDSPHISGSNAFVTSLVYYANCFDIQTVVKPSAGKSLLKLLLLILSLLANFIQDINIYGSLSPQIGATYKN